MSIPKLLHRHDWNRHASQIRTVHHPFSASEVKLVDYIKQCQTCGFIQIEKTVPAEEMPAPVQLPTCIYSKLELQRD